MRVSPNLRASLHSAHAPALLRRLQQCAEGRSRRPSEPSSSTKYYKDDGPGESLPADLDAIPDATPRLEALSRFANRPYTVLGKDYVPATTLRSLQGARHRLVVWAQVPRPEDVERRDVRHVRDDAPRIRRCRCRPTRASPMSRRARAWSCG